MQVKIDMAILKVVNMIIYISKSYNKVVAIGILLRAILWFCVFQKILWYENGHIFTFATTINLPNKPLLEL